MVEIKFCENNFSHGTEEVVHKLKEHFDNVNIEVESCLGFCGECAESPFVLVNDELVQADTPGELYEAIEEIIE